jgi:cytochrome c553
MKYLLIKIFVIIIIIHSFQACVYQRQEVVACDTLSLSYQQDILPIINTNCYICHSAANNASQGNSVNLEGYANIKSELDQGYVIPNIKHMKVPGKTIDFMPLNAAMLPACDIAQIQAWYNAGAPNN